MNKNYINRDNLYLSTLAFIDEDAAMTNKRYLVEFCKLVIYQNGYTGLRATEICDKIKDLVQFEYTEEEIEKVLQNDGRNEIIFEEGVYSITSNVAKEIEHREKTFGLRKHIDIFCDLNKEDVGNYSRDDLCNLIMKFLFEKFQQSLEQISCIINGNKDNLIEYSDQYSENEKTFINSFLSWDNQDKNIMVYNLIVKSYDFYTLNCDVKTSFDFSKFHFYLDANIIMRLLGINNSYRQNAIKHFLNKCDKENINIHVSSFTKVEIEKSIDRQIQAIAREVSEMGYLSHPSSMKFAKSDSFTIEMYGKYYEYCNKKKDSSYEGFKRHLTKQLNSYINKFSYEDAISFEAIEPETFNGLVKSLKQFKDEKVVKTDINNILLVCKKREENSDTYMISADGKLIEWCKQIFVGKTSIVEFPSVWLSLIMKYTGRATGNDYAAFCRFIRLPINPVDKDIAKKIEIKKKVINMDVSNQIKDRMLEELEGNFVYYQEYPKEEIANIAYDKIMEEHDAIIRKEEQSIHEQAIMHLNEKHEHATESILKQLKDKDENSIERRIQKEIERKVSNKQAIGEWIEKHEKRLYLGGLVALITVSFILFGTLKEKISLTMDVETFGVILALGDIAFEYGVCLLIQAIKEICFDKEKLQEKYKRIIRRKYKRLL